MPIMDIENEVQGFDNSAKKVALPSLLCNQDSLEPMHVNFLGKLPWTRRCSHGKLLEQFEIEVPNLAPHHVDDLINWGWDREGQKFVKILEGCCPYYSFRLDTTQFKLSQNYRQVLKKLHNYCKSGQMKSEISQGNLPHVKNGKSTKRDNLSLQNYMDEIIGNCLAHKLEIRVVRSDSQIMKDTFDESFQLFADYQQRVHGNNFSRAEFERRQITSQLNAFASHPDLSHCGTFHRQAYLDGKLISVSMFDVWPNYLWAQYVYYNPDLKHLNLGTFMMLDLICYTNKLAEVYKRPIYFHSGMFMHFNTKHHYKIPFATDIHCIFDQTWVPYEPRMHDMLLNGIKIMAENKSSTDRKISSLLCLYNGQIVEFENLDEHLNKDA